MHSWNDTIEVYVSVPNLWSCLDASWFLQTRELVEDFWTPVMLEGLRTHQELVFFSWALNINVLVKSDTGALESLCWTQIHHVVKRVLLGHFMVMAFKIVLKLVTGLQWQKLPLQVKLLPQRALFLPAYFNSLWNALVKSIFFTLTSWSLYIVWENKYVEPVKATNYCRHYKSNLDSLKAFGNYTC